MRYHLLLIRPLNCLFIGLAVLIGALLNNQVENIFALVSALVAAIFIAGGGYVINDFYDLPIDVINKPRRILPRGVISPAVAYMYAIFLFIFGFSVSFFTANLWAILIALVNTLLLFLYAKRLKRIVLLGNFIVAFTTASAFLFGGVVANNVLNILPVFVYTFLYTLVREIIKDAEDRKGDQRFGAKSLATVYGERKAVLISLIPALLLLVSLFFSFREELISQAVFITITLLFVIPLATIYTYILSNPTTLKLSRSSRLIKMHMLLLLLVLIIMI